jgi:hypothetical protein
MIRGRLPIFKSSLSELLHAPHLTSKANFRHKKKASRPPGSQTKFQGYLIVRDSFR